MSYDLVTGDTGSSLVVNIKDTASAVVNLTGATIKFRWEGEDGVLVERTATISDAVNGVAEYQFATNEIFATKMRVEVEVTDSAGKIITGTDLITLQVREQLG